MSDRLFIVISGPKNGGKTTLANSIAESSKLQYLRESYQVQDCSDILTSMVDMLKMGDNKYTKEDLRDYKIGIGEAIRGVSKTALIDATLCNFSDVADWCLLAGIANVDELNACKEYAVSRGMKFLHIFQSMYSDTESKNTEVGDIFPGDCRVNMMDVADMWNPQKEVWESMIERYFY